LLNPFFLALPANGAARLAGAILNWPR
jgi:hypothetical protein